MSEEYMYGLDIIGHDINRNCHVNRISDLAITIKIRAPPHLRLDLR